VVTGLIQIRELTATKGTENVAFRRYLRNHHYCDDAFARIAESVTREIDCTSCANCCRQTVVTVTEVDIESIARFLGMECEAVRRLYLIPDPDAPGQMIIRNEPDGCIFLDGNLCTIYDVRPKTCQDFPHLTTGRRTLAGRMANVAKRAWMCPIVYNTLEEYKHLVGWHAKPGGALSAKH
jgi:Fe-S-cluster containining protein